MQTSSNGPHAGLKTATVYEQPRSATGGERNHEVSPCRVERKYQIDH
jgi:hypothetical protein